MRISPIKNPQPLPVVLPAFEGCLGDGAHRAFSRDKRLDVVDNTLAHQIARVMRCGADMREQHDIVHRNEFGGDIRLVIKHIEACGKNLLVA